MVQPSGMAQRRSFLVLDEGELEGTDGYWAEDEEDGAEGFLDALEDVFWVFDDAEFTWYQRRQGRQTRRGNGKGKGRRKGKGKGRGGRRFFRPRKGKGQGKGRGKGRSHMVSEGGYEDEWQEGDDWNESYEGYWAEDYNWNEGYWAFDDLYYLDEHGYFQKKGKGKGKKGKKGKDDDGKGGKLGDGKGKSNYVQPQTTSTPAIQNQQQQQAHYSSAASSSGHGFFAFAQTEPARVDVLTATYAEREEHRRTCSGGQNQRDATAQHNRRELKKFPVLVGDLDALRWSTRK